MEDRVAGVYGIGHTPEEATRNYIDHLAGQYNKLRDLAKANARARADRVHEARTGGSRR